MKAGVGFRRQYAELKKKKNSPAVCTLGFIGLLHTKHSRRQGIRGTEGGGHALKYSCQLGSMTQNK